MRKFLSVCAALAVAGLVYGECQAGPKAPPASPAKSVLGSAAKATTSSTQEELDFLENGPRLFPMDKALEVSAKTGKPVICWMGPHIFADAKARELSRRLGETTIQAVMDSDGTEYDRFNPRIKFSTDNYGTEGKTFFVQVKNFNADTEAKVLKALRGAGK